MVRKKSKVPLLVMAALLTSLSSSAFADDSKLGRISGYKFHDLNGDGYDNKEPRLPGFTITLTDKRGNYVDSEITDSLGRFSFRNLPPGKYKVCETAPEATPPWVHTTPECVNVLLRGKAPHVKVKFGNKKATVGQIVGLKFKDLNGSGSFDEGEPGLSGWTINITGITDPGYLDTTTTDADGRYSFTNLPLGQYKICEVPQATWNNTTPICVERELTEEVLSVRALFGNNKEEPVLGSISGYKFHDVNRDSEQNGEEQRLPGWTISLASLSDPSFPSQTDETDSNGIFSFSDLPIGTYQVCEIIPVAPPVWINITPSCVTIDISVNSPIGSAKFGNDKEENGGGPGCTRTQGYWKNHESHASSLIGAGLQLGDTTYTAAEIDTILETPPAGGNALISLAHQLIATLLNQLNGVDVSSVQDHIDEAQDLINGYSLPGDSVHNSTSTGQAMNTEKTELDEYNNGNRGVPKCN